MSTQMYDENVATQIHIKIIYILPQKNAQRNINKQKTKKQKIQTNKQTSKKKNMTHILYLCRNFVFRENKNYTNPVLISQ